MKRLFLFLMVVSFVCCDKAIEVNLPKHNTELTVEMYLENGYPLRCLLSESLPYDTSKINSLKDDALVILSDGVSRDTLHHQMLQDWETGRVYNYFNHKKLKADNSKKYTLTVTDKSERKLEAVTEFLNQKVYIGGVVSETSPTIPGKYSVGLTFNDPGGKENYYRILITKRLNDFVTENTDFTVADLAFDGRRYSHFSDAVYSKGDSVLVRLYELKKDHYNYIQSVNTARRANNNLFTQPANIKSNITGGLGIFTANYFDEKWIVVR